MSIDFYWRLPTHGCHASVRRGSYDRGDWSPLAPGNQAPGLTADGEDDGYRYIDHLAEIAKAAEVSGFIGGLIPSFPNTDDPWVISPLLARETKSFRFMIAFQPGFLNPVQAARLSASLQRATGGRTVYNIITGGGGPSQLWWGDSFSHDDRYGRTTEFLDVLKGVWKDQDFSYDGRFYKVEHGGLPPLLGREEIPEIWFSGSSDAALQSAAKHADYYLSWLEPFDQLTDKFARVKERTAALGGEQKCAVRVDLVARATEEEAWRDIRIGFENVSDETRARWRGQPTDSVGAARQAALKPTEAKRYEELIVAPNLWGGFNLLRGGPALGIVGSYEQCAAKLDELIARGTDAFILAGTPHLEEAYRVGEEVLPLLGRKAETLLQAAE
ncbi:LLM class flavin-dependent oxidoreductase [Sphingomonas colocasiae]|uniref:LLM class flavin-dependent oxidoreductase n=1 Tax=Sphingomonas colocasiae TaxID=1848973 RepID=A0ABS7PIZ4_9SPHN|nr:LLM class flavin-dependent oxidoreductase [Sphingomonas colocasiae]MBY8821203.1 LLM class flavin-dependent oxidoreductase [Sphingomonas colocasiae]